MMSNNQNIETVSSSGDKVKIVLAVICVLLGIFAYYWFGPDNASSVQLPGWSRALIFVLSVLVAAFLVWMTNLGKRIVGFGEGSYRELRQVVWPTRKETIQMTGVVFAFVMAMAIFLWIVDKIVEWLIYGQFLGWGG
ncbi:preprotein translocase subunit SecE [Basilea psittacipulmonis]|uniref:Protein translocase subunit SecE n=1 Tax=Basilea psittacipulmonis DSM 24701 TaxID=1072685 RepID=A0A077DF10_9BURK|nr:preprotein translocase subunit SecE [Basilea psittacipulmonis]AIL33369.1 preprotein translocase subunit SecE [Basilea psittacipulmonis DSM 24701]